MATKKKKSKLRFYIVVGLIAFFSIYIIGFFAASKIDTKEEDNKLVREENVADSTLPLLSQLESSRKVYISDKKTDTNIKIEKDRWTDYKYYFNEFSRVRNAISFEPTYSGYSSNGIKFSTDLDFLKVYTVEKEEFYKIPVSQKKDFEKVINESIYTSFDFAINDKKWKSVHISKGQDVKNIHKWKYNNLVSKMRYKRHVGKVQPEKARDKSKYNYSVYIDGEGFSIRIDTMGPNYIKIISGKNGEYVAYYEVYNDMYKCIKENIFKE